MKQLLPLTDLSAGEAGTELMATLMLRGDQTLARAWGLLLAVSVRERLSHQLTSGGNQEIYVLSSEFFSGLRGWAMEEAEKALQRIEHELEQADLSAFVEAMCKRSEDVALESMKGLKVFNQK